MKLKRSDQGSATVLEVAGRLDGATSDTLLATLQEIIATAPSQLILDLSGMDYVSSAGLRVLLMAAKQVRGRPTRLTLCALRPNVAVDLRNQRSHQRLRHRCGAASCDDAARLKSARLRAEATTPERGVKEWSWRPMRSPLA